MVSKSQSSEYIKLGKKDSETNQKRKENEHRYDFDLGSKQIERKELLVGKVAPPQRPRRSSRFRLASACRGFGKKNSTPTGEKGTAAKPFDGDALTARRTRSRRRGWQRRHRRRLQAKQEEEERTGRAKRKCGLARHGSTPSPVAGVAPTRRIRKAVAPLCSLSRSLLQDKGEIEGGEKEKRPARRGAARRRRRRPGTARWPVDLDRGRRSEARNRAGAREGKGRMWLGFLSGDCSFPVLV